MIRLLTSAKANCNVDTYDIVTVILAGFYITFYYVLAKLSLGLNVT